MQSTMFHSANAIKVWNMTDTKKYPVCLADEECENLDGHACFQYFCYPWKERAVEAGKPTPLFRGCRRNKDCAGIGKGGKKGKCFR